MTVVNHHMYKDSSVTCPGCFAFESGSDDPKLFVRNASNPVFVPLSQLPRFAEGVEALKASKEKKVILRQLYDTIDRRQDLFPSLDDIIASGLLLELVLVLEGDYSFATKYEALRLFLVFTIQQIPCGSLLADQRCIKVLVGLVSCDSGKSFVLTSEEEKGMKTNCVLWSCVCLHNILVDSEAGAHVCGVLLEHEFTGLLVSRMTNMRSLECLKYLLQLIERCYSVAKSAFPDKICLFRDICREFPRVIREQHLSDTIISECVFDCLYSMISTDESLFTVAADAGLLETLLQSLNIKCFAGCFRCLNLFCQTEIPPAMLDVGFRDLVMSMFNSLDAPSLAELFKFVTKGICDRVLDVDIPEFTGMVLKLGENAPCAVIAECSNFLVSILGFIVNHVPPCEPAMIDSVVDMIAQTLEQKPENQLLSALRALVELTQNHEMMQHLTVLPSLKQTLTDLNAVQFRDTIELILSQLNDVL